MTMALAIQKLRTCCLAGAILALATSMPHFSGPALAQESAAKPIPIAVVAVFDMQRIFRNARAAQSVSSQVKSFYDAGLGEITSREDGLRQEQQALARQRPLLSPEAYGERERAFRANVGALDARRRELDRQLQNLRSRGEIAIRRAMVPIFEELSRTRGITMIIPSTPGMFAIPATDLTDEVLARLDESLPEVDLSLPDTQ